MCPSPHPHRRLKKPNFSLPSPASSSSIKSNRNLRVLDQNGIRPPFQPQVQKPKYECLLFDVDDTLYPLSSGLSEQCSLNIKDYMINKLSMDENEVPTINIQLYKDYGTTMAGLRALGYEFDVDDFHSFVHGILPYETLRPDPVLKNLLHSLPIQKVLFFDDSLRNLQTSKRLGIHTVLSGSSHRSQGVDHTLESIHNIREALPELWETQNTENIHYPEHVSIETYVRA